MKMKIKISPAAEANLMEAYGLEILEGIINKKYIKRIKNASNKDELTNEFKKIAEENKIELIKKKKEISKEFNKLEKNYNKELKKIFNRPLKEKTCYLTAVYLGMANMVEGKSFFVRYDVEEKFFKYLFFHELTHLHYGDLIKKSKTKSEAGLSPIVESIAHLVIFKTKIKDILSIEIEYSTIAFVIRNKEFMKKIEGIWENRKSFNSFLEEAIKLNKEIKEVVIC